MSWNTPKEALDDVLSKLTDDAELVEIKAWRERGRVYCTTFIKYPKGQLGAEHNVHDYHAPSSHCKARCDC